ncbi:hypothetical protein JCM6882_001347 [Rhodosporidiobolus microsporus]
MSTHAPSTLAADARPAETTVDLTARFVVQQLERHRSEYKGEGRVPPLVLGVQGPQGSGKSYLASLLPTALSQPENGSLRTATLSLDDLYLPHSGLRAVAEQHKGNKLLNGRGQAGTHEVQLGLEVLRALKKGGKEPVEVPVFEKSLHGGEGDRLPREQWVKVDDPQSLDVVVLEGWMTGFLPVAVHDPSLSLSALYSAAESAPEAEPTQQLLGIDYAPPFLLQHSLEDLEQVEGLLESEGYRELWSEIDIAVQIKPEGMGYVWEWRLEQEHNMKAKNGGVGMTDEQVKNFIARYMPAYELQLPGFAHDSQPWAGKPDKRGLRILVGKGREVVGVEEI